ncbi:unnamed protein product [marine sediment metagenome]|uniref:Uncharacterized protein n=1 Tax=marine sediment metagenome TaxID=412755 RepID=X1W397_9ZZZZ
MDFWTLVAFIWLALGDTLTAIFIGWKLAPERAERLVMKGLLNPTLGAEVRPAWGIPSVKDIKDNTRSINQAINRVSRKFEELEKQKVNVHIDAVMVDDITKSLMARLRPTLKDNIQEAVNEAVKELPALRGDGVVSPEAIEEELMLEDLLTELIDEYPEHERKIKFAASKGRAAFKYFAMSRYPDEYLAITGAEGLG